MTTIGRGPASGSAQYQRTTYHKGRIAENEVNVPGDQAVLKEYPLWLSLRGVARPTHEKRVLMPPELDLLEVKPVSL